MRAHHTHTCTNADSRAQMVVNISRIFKRKCWRRAIIVSAYAYTHIVVHTGRISYSEIVAANVVSRHHFEVEKRLFL